MRAGEASLACNTWVDTQTGLRIFQHEGASQARDDAGRPESSMRLLEIAS